MTVGRERTDREGAGVSLIASLAPHLAFAPVAFAVTEGPEHAVRYANIAFQSLQDGGAIVIGNPERHPEQHPEEHPEQPGTDITPLLDRAFRSGETIRDELLVAPKGTGRWHCTVWPIATDSAVPEGLVVEIRDAAYVEGAMARQRDIAQRLLLGALREQDTARDATETSRRADFLAATSRDLSRSLDLEATQALVRRITLPRKGTWCIVDIIESNGAIHRLAVVHPDPAKQELARAFADRWYPRPDDPDDVLSLTRLARGEPLVITKDSEGALVAAVHGPGNLAILRQLGFGSLLVVPLMIRTTVLGTITFVTPESGPPFSPEEISLAADLADRCAMALDNARLYREADVLRQTAVEANRVKSQFLGSMSHELRTPLNAIGGYVELLQMAAHGPLNPEQRADLERIKHNQEHLIALIGQILTFVRTESGRMEYRYGRVPVRGAVEDVVHLLDGAARERRIALEVQLGDSDADLWADPDRVRQILVNLVMNAVKYSSTGRGAITVSSTATVDTVSIHVADNGAGIPAEKLDEIFEPFVQLAEGFTSRQGGVGLGLAISRDLARAMSGDLTVESTVGVGSRFTLTLPRARQT